MTIGVCACGCVCDQSYMVYTCQGVKDEVLTEDRMKSLAAEHHIPMELLKAVEEARSAERLLQEQTTKVCVE